MQAFRGKKVSDVEGAAKVLEKIIAESKKKASAPEASLLFAGERRYWRQSGNTHSWPAYSGRKEYWQNKRFRVEDQKVRNKGPLPSGFYSVKQTEYQTIPIDFILPLEGLVGHGTWPGLTPSWGVERVWIYPEAGINVYGRSGFSIHGGTDPGSAGCIDLVGNMVFFAEKFLFYGKDMRLEVRYPSEK